jgi:hypothetical protein
MKILLLALLLTSLCLAVQAIAAILSIKASELPLRSLRRFRQFHRLSLALAVLLLGIVAQMAVWAIAWRALGEFSDFQEALYFSGVTFTSLGYGDIVVKGPHRLLAPLEATTGLIMFAVLTAVFLQAFQRQARGRVRPEEGGNDSHD